MQLRVTESGLIELQTFVAANEGTLELCGWVRSHHKLQRHASVVDLKAQCGHQCASDLPFHMVRGSLGCPLTRFLGAG